MQHTEQKSNNRYTELIKNTAMLAVGNFSSKILVFLLVPLYTSILSTSEYGYYDLVLTTLQLLTPLFTLNVTEGVLRFVLDNESNTKQVFRISLKYLSISIIPAALLLGTIGMTGISQQTTDYGFFIFIYYLSSMYNQFLIQFAKSVDKVKFMTISGIIGTMVTVVSCVLLLKIWNFGLTGFFIANTLGQAIPCIFLMIVLRIWQYIGGEYVKNADLEKKLLKYSLPLILSSIGWWINNTFDRYIITYMKGVDINGLLSVAYKIPSVLSVIYGLFIQAWQISAMKEYGKNNSKSFYNQVYIFLNLFMFYIAAVLILLTKPIARLTFANDFYSAWIFVPFLLLSGVFISSAGYIAPILTSSYDTRTVARSTIYGGIINIVLNIVLIKLIGSVGVTVATAISSFVILYIRYHSLHGIIDCKVFMQSAVMWLALALQAYAVINDLFILEIIVIIVVTILNIKKVKFLAEKIISVFNKRPHKF